MTADRFRRLAELFDALRDLSLAERAPRLDVACEGDDVLRRELVSLLRQHDAAESRDDDRLLDAGSRLRDGIALEVPAPTRLPETIGRFVVRGEIARGGFGVVLRGEDPTIGRDVAIKILPPDDGPTRVVADLLRAEGRIGGRLQHPGIVPVYELGEIDTQRPFVAMKVVEGRTLSALLRDRADPTTDRARFLVVFEQVCQAIAYAHARRVIHRDLKPQNVMLGAFGEVQVMDWGLAMGLDEPRDPTSATQRGSVALGTPAYMAPEQARGDAAAIDPRSDVFGLGAILCEILTGAPPFAASDAVTTLARARSGDTADAIRRIERSGADAEIVAVALRCLAIAPADRPADGAAVANAVRSHLESLDERARRAELDAASARARAAAERKARRTTTVLGAVVVLVTLGGTASWLATTNAAHERQRIASARLRDAFVEAQRLVADAEAEVPASVSRWSAAATAAANTARLIGVDAEPGLAATVRTLYDRAERQLRDVRFAERLEAIGLDDRFLNTYDRSGQLAEYELTLGDYLGTHPDATTVADARQRFAEFPFQDRLIAALDTWSRSETQRDRNSARAAWLSALADALDTDPWRREVRAAIQRRDRRAIVALVTDPRADTAPASACVELAIQLTTSNDIAAAIDLLTRAQVRFPGDFETALNLSFVLLDGGDRNEALRFATVAWAMRPKSALPNAVMAEALWALEHRTEAVAAARRSIALAASSVSPQVVAARVLLYAGLLDEAEAVAARYQSAVPANHAAYPNYAELLGDVRCLQGRFEEALDAYLDAVGSPASWPGDPRWWHPDPAIPAALEHAIRDRRARDGDLPILRYLEGRLREDAGAAREALAIFEAIEARWPDFPHVRSKIVTLSRQLGGTLVSPSAVDRALAKLDKAVSEADARALLLGNAANPRAPTPEILEFAEGMLALRAGRPHDAIPHLQRAVEADRESPVTWRRLHDAWTRAEDRARADDEIRRLLTSAPLPEQIVDIPPAAPTQLGPTDGAADDVAPELVVDGFSTPDPRRTLGSTVWQVRDVDADVALAPRIELATAAAMRLQIPAGLCNAGRTYAWRAAFVAEDGVAQSEWSPEHTFRIPADGPHPVPIDLARWCNVDVVADPGDPTGEPFDPPNHFQLVVDGFDGTQTAVPTVHGLPVDRRIDAHVLRPYDGPNAIRIAPGAAAPLRIELPDVHAVGVRILLAGANGNAVLYSQVVDAAGTVTDQQIVALDWFATGLAERLGLRGAGVAIWRRMDRMGPDGLEERNGAALFEIFVPTDPARQLIALTIDASLSRFDSPTTTAQILAVTVMQAGTNGR